MKRRCGVRTGWRPVQVCPGAPRQPGEQEADDRQRHDEQPAAGKQEPGRVVLVRRLEVVPQCEDEDEGEGRRGDDARQQAPAGADPRTTVDVEVLAEASQGAHRPRDGQHADQRRDEDAVLVDEMVDDVEHVDAARRAEEHQAQHRSGNADREGRGQAADVELVADRGDHDFDHADQRGDAGDDQRPKEQDAEEGSGRCLADDRGEGDEREPDPAAGYLADGHALGLGHEAQGGEHADAREQLEARVRKADDKAGAACRRGCGRTRRR